MALTEIGQNVDAAVWDISDVVRGLTDDEWEQMRAIVLKVIETERGIKAAQAGAALGTSGPTRSATAQGCNKQIHE